MTRSERIVLKLGAAYVIALGAMHIGGAGLAAAFLTMPSGLALFGIAYLLETIVPPSLLERTVWTFTGNLFLLVGSGALNVALAYLVVRTTSRRGRG